MSACASLIAASALTLSVSPARAADTSTASTDARHVAVTSATVRPLASWHYETSCSLFLVCVAMGNNGLLHGWWSSYAILGVDVVPGVIGWYSLYVWY
jgi:hypothetical protein